VFRDGVEQGAPFGTGIRGLQLYLEGAEDFDRISGFAAETVQVKNVVGNVTLRSRDAIEAIDNAWAHQQKGST
jgi:hypothetical protein